MPKPLAIGLTFLAVMVGWVFFKAHDVASANRMLASMAGLNGFDGWPPDAVVVVKMKRALVPIAIGLFVVWALPNTQEFLRRYRPALDVAEATGTSAGPRRWWHWRPTWQWLLFTLVVLYAVGRDFDQLSEFIYFQF
jgi:hypothetical protein